MNPIHPIMWQFIYLFREETLCSGFTDEQRNKLLEQMDICENNYQSPYPIKQHKSNMAFVKFENLYKKYGGDMERLNEKVDIIYNQVDPKIIKVSSMIIDNAASIKRCAGVRNLIGKIRRK